FHRHVGHAPLGEPVRQGQQVRGHGLEGPHLVVGVAPLVESADAGDDRLLMHVEAGAAAVEDVHGGLLGGLRRRTPSVRTSYRACSPAGATVSGSWRCPGQTALRATGTEERTASVRSKTSPHPNPLAPIFIVSGCRT